MDSSSSTRIFEGRLACDFKSGYSLISAHRRKVIEEYAKAIARLKVFKENTNRHPSAHKNRLAAQNIHISVIDSSWVKHGNLH
jgi:hypothetical protein